MQNNAKFELISKVKYNSLSFHASQVLRLLWKLLLEICHYDGEFNEHWHIFIDLGVS